MTRNVRRTFAVFAVLAVITVLATVSGCSSNGAGGGTGGSSAPETYNLGDTGPAGGIVFYDKGEFTDGWRYLEAAPASTEWESKPWGGGGSTSEVGEGANGTAIGTGAANTQAIVAEYGANEPDDNRSDYAAKLCDDLEYGGYSDWFLPSKDELNEMYKQREAIGDFPSADHWSSSENTAFYAWKQYFGDGSQGDFAKGYTYRVRAVRAF